MITFTDTEGNNCLSLYLAYEKVSLVKKINRRPLFPLMLVGGEYYFENHS